MNFSGKIKSDEVGIMKSKLVAGILMSSFLLSACAGKSGDTTESENKDNLITKALSEKLGEDAEETEAADTEEAAAGATTEETTDANSGDATEEVEDTNTGETAEEVEVSEDSVVSEELEEPELSDYQTAYMDIVKEGQFNFDENGDMDFEEYENMMLDKRIYCYWLYDIDKDDVPELILKYGTCEADFHGSVYTYKNGKTELLTDEFPLGHTGLYSDPGENGIICYWGHMGYASVSRFRFENGETAYDYLYEENINERIENGEEDADYAAARDIVNGAYYLSAYDTNTLYPIIKYTEIAQYQAGKKQPESGPFGFPDDNENIYKELIENDGTVIAAATDEYMNSPGKVSFSELLKDGVIYPYTSGALRIFDDGYADFNSDGIYEYYFYFNTEDSDYHSYRGIISKQGEEFYVYLSFSTSETSISEDGYLIHDNPDYNEYYRERILFDKEDSVIFSME